MGAANSSDQIPTFQYAKFVTDPLPGETGVLRYDDSEEQIPADIQNLRTLQDLALRSFDLYPANPFLGTRIQGEYQWKTYSQIQEQASALGSALIQRGLIGSTTFDVKEYRCIGIFSKNREEWVVADIAAMLYNFSLVPLYDSLGDEGMEYIITQTEMKSIILSGENFRKFVDKRRAGMIAGVQNVVLMDQLSQEQVQIAQQIGVDIIEMQELYQNGSEFRLDYFQVEPDSCFTISYTSGTTGLPKGVIITHQMAIAKVIYTSLISDLEQQDRFISYLPLPHILERTIFLQIMFAGCSTGFYSGDIFKLREDLVQLKPTLVACVPRLLTRFYDGLQENFANLPEDLQKIYKAAVNTKLAQLPYGKFTHPLYDTLFFNKAKQIIGGRVRMMFTGAAAIKAEVLNYLKIAFCCNIGEGYGQTETMTATLMKREDPNGGKVGGPSPGIDIKLVDIPEMNYLTSDVDSNGQIRPRGEVLLKGPYVFSKYFKNPEATAQTVDEEGWNHSGDVAELLPDLSLKIIDRKKNIFKLSNGEYVAPEKLENINVLSPFIQMNFVYGDSFSNDLVAIVVPDEQVVSKWAKNNGIEGNFEQHCQNSRLYEVVIQDLAELADQYNLQRYERVKKI